TDDQGWGEVGFHGNKVLKTPNLDRFAAEGLELTQFYVSPMCTPTRSSLMTGRYHFRTGAHDTYIGRSNMNPQETTIAEVFAGAGYRTGIFGKWHLGENYPMRAQDQGFQKVVVHGGGGIGQFADYPGNTYYDPTLLYNDDYKKAKGYCTDIFIDESIEFMSESKDPFFCYIPLNIPHSPFVVDKEFRESYDRQNLKDPDGRNWVAPIYGMITQFDGAFQRLLDKVEALGMKDNTIIIFMTDNGPNSTYFTAGLRARKSSVYENGFRVPFVVQWPGGIPGGRKLHDPTMHIDLLPTLAEACGIPLPGGVKLDGRNILPLLTGKTKALPERFLFMQHNRANVPPKYKNCMVRKGPWKAVGNRGTPEGFEFYNIEQDPGEKTNLASEHPDKVRTFVRAYETWFDDVTAELAGNQGMPHPIELSLAQKVDYSFTWQDWWGEKTGWRPQNYGRWRMKNPGLIDRFDV
ncbi:MAG: arylsulfatase, partial [Verrucomicrobiota bacterium]